MDSQALSEEIQMQRQQQARAAAEDEQRAQIMAQLLDSEARERLNKIALVKPDRAREAETRIMTAARAGQIEPPVTDDQLVALLERIAPSQQGTKITFIRRR